MKFASALTLLAMVAFMTGCAMPTRVSIRNSVSTDLITSADFVDNSVKPIREGTATSEGILFVASGDDSINTAMKNGNITKVHSIDYKTTNILGIVSKSTTIVRGE